MSNSKTVDVFNRDLIKFFDELIDISQAYKTLKKNNMAKELKKYKTLIEAGMLLNNKKIIEEFVLSVVPMKKQIDSFDEDFFLGKKDNEKKQSFDQMLKKTVKEKKEEDLDAEINKVRELYPYIKGSDRADYQKANADESNSLAENDKKYIWQTLQYLCGLAVKYYNSLT
jgi:hypothetical protein